MYLKRISVEHWIGNINQGQLIENANWDTAKSAISELDGKIRTMVTLETDDEANMVIGGGESNQYLAYVTFDNEIFHYLLDNSKSDNLVQLVVGGQLGEYPAKMCINLQKILYAAKAFAEEGKLLESEEWEEG